MGFKYVAHTTLGYFNEYGCGGEFYIIVDSNNDAVAISPNDNSVIQTLTNDSNRRLIPMYLNGGGHWEAFKTLKEMKAYIFQLELDKSLMDSN